MAAKLTILRREILTTIRTARRPMSVQLIAQGLRSNPNLSTIYRALTFLEDQDLVHSIAFSGRRFYFVNVRGHGHFLICKECHEILDFTDCVVARLQKKIQRRFSYKITDHILFFKGLCPECQNYLDKKLRYGKSEIKR
jgi:Fur family ferric uptake transcriptional regulator